MECRLIAAICEELGVWIEHHSLVTHNDRMALGVDADSLITGPIAETGTLPVPTFGLIEPTEPEEAEEEFLEEYERLTRGASVRHLALVAERFPSPSTGPSRPGDGILRPADRAI